MKKNLVFILIFIIIVSCQGQGPKISSEKMFSVEYGLFENQIDAFLDFDVRGPNELNSYISGEKAYIVNGKAAKVLGFDFQGDLKSIIYNPQKNQAPQIFQNLSYSSGFELLMPSNIQIIQGIQYIVDVSQENLKKIDPSLGVVPDNVILRFSNNGKLLDYLGQNGIGTSPFPEITELYGKENGELFVICQVPDRYIVYWFEASMKRKLRVDINRHSLPVPDDRQWRVNLANVKIDADLPVLHAQIEYFPADSHQSVETRIYEINLANGHWDNFITLPYLYYKNTQIQDLYHFEGTVSGGYFYFTSRIDANEIRLSVIDKLGRLYAERILVAHDADAIIPEMKLAHDGRLYGLYNYLNNAQFEVYPTQISQLSKP